MRRKEHHLCEEPECEYCFVAYNTTEELRQHRSQVSVDLRSVCNAPLCAVSCLVMQAHRQGLPLLALHQGAVPATFNAEKGVHSLPMTRMSQLS